jgi:hyperosmotically inducible periplasmic protein
MNRVSRKSVRLAVSVTMLLALGACNRPMGDRVGADGGSAKRAAADAGRNAKDAKTSAASAHTAAADDTRTDSTKTPSDSTRSMGAAGEKVDDAAITASVNASLARDKDLSAIRIDVDTQDGVVTLSGLAPSASAKEHASEVAHKVAGVQSVNNQLTIKSS